MISETHSASRGFGFSSGACQNHRSRQNFAEFSQGSIQKSVNLIAFPLLLRANLNSLAPPFMNTEPEIPVAEPVRTGVRIALFAAAALVAGMLVWQGVTARGVPNPVEPNTSPTVAVLDIGILVFREGLESILVLAAITASMVGVNSAHKRPVVIGAGVGVLATILTWFIAVGILSTLMESIPALHLQAATGLLAVIVLLVVMNWFFHKVYWGGWIKLHNRKKKALLSTAQDPGANAKRLFWGLIILGCASMYREGFEIVLFLQSYRLKMGSNVVLSGASIGVVLTAIVAVLTFVAHRRLPYRKMLIGTGVMLGFVLLVMVGEQVQEMQLAHWISTTEIHKLANVIPGWMGMWFAVFPNVEGIGAQALAALLVIGSYFAARHHAAGGLSEPATPSIAANVSVPSLESAAN
jgi:high-affinity iron transporter